MKITVIGGGVIGLSCAWRLAQRGASVTLFDARPPHQNASSAALGALWPASPLARGPLQTLHRQSLWQFEPFLHELSTFSQIEIPFRRAGRIELLNSPKAFIRAQQESSVAQLEWPASLSPNAPIMETLTPDAVQKLLPTLTAPNHGALLCRATAQVHVPSLLAALLRANQRANVTLHHDTPITSLPLPNTDLTLITTGAWTKKLLPLLPITPAKGQALALECPSNYPLPQILKSGPTYLIPWQSELLLGATTEPEAQFNESPTPEARAGLLSRAVTLFPELAHAKILRHWTGLRPDAPNHNPIMGKLPTHPNTYIATAHYKTGLALAPLVSHRMTTLLFDGITPPELTPFSPNP